MSMPKGEYYIGDLCYVMTSEEWAEVHSLLYPHTGRNADKMSEGEFYLSSGKKFCCFGTMHGDGTYLGKTGLEYGVDSGSIGCVLLSDIDPSRKELILCGNIHTMKNNFSSYREDGLLIFGDITIDTDPPIDPDNDWDIDPYADEDEEDTSDDE